MLYFIYACMYTCAHSKRITVPGAALPPRTNFGGKRRSEEKLWQHRLWPRNVKLLLYTVCSECGKLCKDKIMWHKWSSSNDSTRIHSVAANLGNWHQFPAGHAFLRDAPPSPSSYLLLNAKESQDCSPQHDGNILMREDVRVAQETGGGFTRRDWSVCGWYSPDTSYPGNVTAFVRAVLQISQGMVSPRMDE